MSNDLYYMTRAIELARQGLNTVRHNPRVGCVLVKDDHIIAEGWHEKHGEAHAEINALEMAGKNAEGASWYLTLEPCTHYGKTPPCVTAMIAAKPTRVVIATVDPNPVVNGQGVAALRAAGIKVEIGLLEAQARALNPGFFKRMQTKKPYVRVKLAMSLDGKIALANGKSQWITGELERKEVQHWRARSCAILTSSQTVLADNPRMTVREEEILRNKHFKQPLRIVVDSQLRTASDAQIYHHPQEVKVVTMQSTTVAPLWHEKGIEVTSLPAKAGHVDLAALMQQLGEWELNEIWVEAGADFAGALCQANLVDEWILYVAPKFLGQQARGLITLAEITELNHAPELIFTECKPIGNDLRIIAHPKLN